MTNKPYEDLANAIILQAVDDYRNTERQKDRAAIERFFRSPWFSNLTSLDGEKLITELRKETAYGCQRVSLPG